MPLQLQEFVEGWRTRHPGWETCIWTEANLPPLVNAATFASAQSPAQKADILRYELLYNYGGVYVDTDFECLKNIEPLLGGVKAFAACEAWNIVSIGILGSTPGHPLLQKAIELVPGSFQNHEHVPDQTGPLFFSKIAFDYVARYPGSVHLFDRHFFYPYHWKEPHRRHESFPWAFAVHHWNGSWTSTT